MKYETIYLQLPVFVWLTLYMTSHTTFINEFNYHLFFTENCVLVRNIIRTVPIKQNNILVIITTYIMLMTTSHEQFLYVSYTLNVLMSIT